jgi:isopentenyldiphosphate isomerase
VRYVLSEVGLGVLWGGAIFVVGNWWIWGVLAVVGMSLVLACNAWSAKRELMSSELVDVVDKNDVVIDVATRETTHRVGLLHRIAAVFVFDDQGRLTIQVRKADEGLLDHSVGGHVASGESYAEAAAREAREGLGVDEVLSFVGVVPVVERRGANHLVALFWCNAKEGWSFVPNDEVGEVLYQEVDEVVEEMSREPERFAPGFVATLGLWLAR